MIKFTAEADLVKLIIKELTIGNGKKGIRDLLSLRPSNWERFKELIIYHELIPFAYLPLKDFNQFMPQDLMEFLKNNYYCALVRCQNIWQEFLRMSMAFEQVGIVIVPIKGVALLEDIYTQKTVRPMTDIDLLVKEDDLSKAELIFCNLGYKKELYDLKEEYWRKNQCHITFYKKDEEKAPFVELHWSLDFRRRNRYILPELWGRIRENTMDGRIIKLLSPEDTLFSLALHRRRFGKTFCLKNVYDAALILNKYTTTFDWDYVLRECREGKICSTIFFLLSQTKPLLGFNIPERIWKDLNIPFWKRELICRFIERNTFLPHLRMSEKGLYLKSHFFLYDSFWEPIEYILNIPKEQFAKYYGLKTYDKKTDFLYRNRLFYIPFKVVLDTLNKIGINGKFIFL